MTKFKGITRDQVRALRAIVLAKQSEILLQQFASDQSIDPMVRMRICDELKSASAKCIERNRQEWPHLNDTASILTHVRNRY